MVFFILLSVEVTSCWSAFSAAARDVVGVVSNDSCESVVVMVVTRATSITRTRINNVPRRSVDDEGNDIGCDRYYG